MTTTAELILPRLDEVEREVVDELAKRFEIAEAFVQKFASNVAAGSRDYAELVVEYFDRIDDALDAADDDLDDDDDDD